MIHTDREKLRSAVINNLVPENKREIIFSTNISDEDNSETAIEMNDNLYLKLEERIEKIECLVKKLVEFLVKENA